MSDAALADGAVLVEIIWNARGESVERGRNVSCVSHTKKTDSNSTHSPTKTLFVEPLALAILRAVRWFGQVQKKSVASWLNCLRTASESPLSLLGSQSPDERILFTRVG